MGMVADMINCIAVLQFPVDVRWCILSTQVCSLIMYDVFCADHVSDPTHVNGLATYATKFTPST